MTPDPAPSSLKLQARLSMLLLAVGGLLVARQMYADDEPGAIPLLLVVLATAWFLITRRKMRRLKKQAPV